MIDLIELESRWFKYKLKSLIPYTVIVSSLIVISVIIYFIQDMKILNTVFAENIQQYNVEKKSVVQNNLPLAKEENITNKIQVTKEETVIPFKQKEIIDDKTVLEPSFGFIKQMQHSSHTYYDNEREEEIVEKKQSIKKAQDTKKVIHKHQEIQTKQKESTILINKRDTYEDIKHVIARFKKNNNPTLSLFVAKKYYELGEYNKSYNYALITNEINNNIEASWIVFTKSLVKLNKKKMAIKTLKAYIRHSQSHKAKLLLDEIISGKFNAQ